MVLRKIILCSHCNEVHYTLNVLTDCSAPPTALVVWFSVLLTALGLYLIWFSFLFVSQNDWEVRTSLFTPCVQDHNNFVQEKYWNVHINFIGIFIGVNCTGTVSKLKC